MRPRRTPAAVRAALEALAPDPELGWGGDRGSWGQPGGRRWRGGGENQPATVPGVSERGPTGEEIVAPGAAERLARLAGDCAALEPGSGDWRWLRCCILAGGGEELLAAVAGELRRRGFEVAAERLLTGEGAGRSAGRS